METNIYFYPKSRALRKFYIYEKTTVIPILNYLLTGFFHYWNRQIGRRVLHFENLEEESGRKCVFERYSN